MNQVLGERETIAGQPDLEYPHLGLLKYGVDPLQHLAWIGYFSSLQEIKSDGDIVSIVYNLSEKYSLIYLPG